MTSTRAGKNELGKKIATIHDPESEITYAILIDSTDSDLTYEMRLLVYPTRGEERKTILEKMRDKALSIVRALECEISKSDN